MIGYIYSIESVITGDIYIGSTIQNPQYRIRNHLYYLKNNEHRNIKLQRLYNKYGKDNLKITILAKLNRPRKNIKEFEGRCIRLIPKNKVINFGMYPEINEFYFLKHTPEAREKNRLAHLGEKSPMWGKRGKLSPLWDTHPSFDTRRKMSESGKKRHRDNPLSTDSKLKISLSLKNHIVTEHTRKLISFKNKGRVSPNKGKILSEQEREKLKGPRPTAQGELNPNSKLSNIQRQEIWYKKNILRMSTKDLMVEYNLNKSTINRVAKNTKWEC